MKSQKFKRVIVVLLVTAMAVALPSSLAKYAESKNYTMTLTKHVAWRFNTYQYETYDKNWYGAITATYQNLYSDIVTLPYAGRYAIIAKGGDGAKGLAWAAQKQAHDYDVDGGVGGTVVGVYTTTKENQNLFVAPGFAGTNQVKGDKSLGGTNALDKFGGGEGGKFTVRWGDVMAWLGSLLSAEPAGGGGGAATVVYQCDENGKYSDADLLIIAGGGGGSPSWNQGYQNSPIGVYPIYSSSYTTPPGQGGMGGSNFGQRISDKTTENNADYKISTVLNAYCKISYDVFNGFDGTGSSETYNHFGTAGTSIGGIGGKSSKACVLGDQLLVGEGTEATNGSTFVNNGTGGNGDLYAGGGGGGYCGGGGGNGTSIDRPAGGAGGGSSYVSSLINQDISINYSAYISEAAAKTEKPIPSQDHPGVLGANEGNGYVIIKYLGPAEGESIDVDMRTTYSMSQDIIDNFNSKHTSGTASITDRTSDATNTAISNDSCLNGMMSGRSWQISQVSGKTILYFTDSKTKPNTSTKNIKVWKYEDGKFYVANNATSDYTYVKRNSYTVTFSKCTWTESSTPPTI